MSEYISREDVINITAETGAWETQNRVRELPAADVQPVKHGKWIDYNPDNENDPRCICSVCGSVEFPLSRHKYCPNCGADMRGE